MKSINVLRSLIVVSLVAFVTLIAHDAFSQWAPTRAPQTARPSGSSNTSKAPTTMLSKSPTPGSTFTVAPISVSKSPAGGGSTISTPPAAISVMPRMIQCGDLPSIGAGYDLMFTGLAMERIFPAHGGPPPILSFNGGIASNPPDRYGSYSSRFPEGRVVHVRVIPGPPAVDSALSVGGATRKPAMSYDLCLSTENGPTTLSFHIAMSYLMTWADATSGEPYLVDFWIILDPENKISETNEANNIIHCTSFDTTPIGTGLVLDPSRSYEGSCKVWDMP